MARRKNQTVENAVESVKTEPIEKPVEEAGMEHAESAEEAVQPAAEEVAEEKPATEEKKVRRGRKPKAAEGAEEKPAPKRRGRKPKNADAPKDTDVKVARKPAKKQEVKTGISVQYMGKDVSDKDMIALVKKDWTASKHKIGEIKTMDLYVKVEEDRVYYVINGTETGSVEI